MYGIISKQELARYRNCNKFMLTSLYKPFRYDCLTVEEGLILDQIFKLQNQLLKEWTDNSIKLGLTVHSKCWCGKIAKYKTDYTDNLVCKKHIMEKEL